MWDWCGYFGEAGDFCVKVRKDKEVYVVETSDERKERLKSGEVKCFSPYGVCVEVRREKKGFRAVIYFLPTQEKLAEVKKE